MIVRARSIACVLGVAFGCGSDAACIEGRQVACACDNGRAGVQVCTSGGAYSACQCSSPSTGEVRDASSPPADASQPTIVDAQTEPTLVDARVAAPVEDAQIVVELPSTADAAVSASSSEAFVAMFAQHDAFLVVDSAGVRKLGLDGAELARWDAPRPVISAAFDGTHLVACDGAKFTTLDTAFKKLIDANTAEACGAAVLLSNHRLICGANVDWQRNFYTYDALTGKQLAAAGPYTYNGVPMRQVRGADAFVTVSGGSPSDYFLYTLDANGAAIFQNESPYHGDFIVNNTYDFDRATPQHLISTTGLLLRFTLDCGASNQCFVKDGALGTIRGSQQFAALDGDGDTLYALVSPDVLWASDSALYRLQTVDVNAREVKSERAVPNLDGSPLALRVTQKKAAIAVQDPWLGGAMLPAYHLMFVDL
jgi:hypothetical protein